MAYVILRHLMYALDGARENCIAAGATGFMAKSFEIRGPLSRVRDMTDNERIPWVESLGLLDCVHHHKVFLNGQPSINQTANK